MAEATDGLPSTTASDAKREFGAVLDRVSSEGKIAIRKHGRVRAVLLSVGEYETLIARQREPLDALAGEFDGLLRRMRTPAARRAGEALFGASSSGLGRAATAGAARRKKRARSDRG